MIIIRFLKHIMEYCFCFVFLALIVDSSSLNLRREGENEPQPEQCPVNDTRTTIDIRDNPYIVDIAGCTGTIVDKRWILTAAHCAYDKNAGFKHREIKSVRVGSHFGDKGRRMEVEANIEHPHFDIYNSIQYDFLLLRLQRPLKLGDRVGLPTLARAHIKDMIPGVTGESLGFGNTCEKAHHQTMSESLRITKEDVKIISIEECRESFHDVDLQGTMLCAKPAFNHCNERGGPLLFDGIVMGIASTVAEHECLPTDPITFASIPFIGDWIRYNMRHYKHKPSKDVRKATEPHA